jgi:NitT/TauT family transport system substrate-binding protein
MSARTLAAIALSLGCCSCTERAPASSRATGHGRDDGSGSTSGLVIRYGDPVNVDVRDVPALMALDALRGSGYGVEIRHVPGPPLVEDLLARGEIDIGITNYQTMWSAIAKGADVRSVAQFVGLNTVMAAQNSLESCADLDGRKMGVYASSGLSQELVQIYLKRRCRGAAPQLIVIEESASRAAALLAGRLDAAVMPGEEFVKLGMLAPGRFRAVMTHREEFPDMRIDGFHVRRAWARAHPQAVRDFIRALLRAQRLVAANPDILYAEAGRRIALDEGTTRAVADSHLRMGIWDPDGGLTAGNVAHILDFLIGITAVPAHLRASDVADLSHLDAVLDEIGRQNPPKPGT